jgi:hypothetical protein
MSRSTADCGKSTCTGCTAVDCFYDTELKVFFLKNGVKHYGGAVGPYDIGSLILSVCVPFFLLGVPCGALCHAASTQCQQPHHQQSVSRQEHPSIEQQSKQRGRVQTERPTAVRGGGAVRQWGNRGPLE